MQAHSTRADRKRVSYSQDADLTKTSAVVNYSSVEMVIARYVVVAGDVKSAGAEQQPQLLVAFTPSLVRERGKADATMAAGSMLWMEAGAGFDLLPSGDTAAHLLAIRLLK
jgi:hypothetical protein